MQTEIIEKIAKKEGLVCLSLFDGISCGQQALTELGINIKSFYASEVDPYPKAIVAHRFPNTIDVGDVTKLKASDLPDEIDILMGGSPCQGFSFAKGSKDPDFDDPRSKLFFEFARLVNELKPKIILLENVPMKAISEEVITSTLGIDPVMINSALLSAQNRKRLYWFGIRQEDGTYKTIPVEQPDDLGLVMADILEDDNHITDRDKSYCIDANYFKGGNLKQYFDKKRRQLVFESESLCKQVGVADVQGWDILKRVYSKYGKGPTCNTGQGGSRITKILISKIRDKSKTVRVGGRGSYDRHEWDSVDNLHWRKLTVLEVERLQTLPDGYTEFGVFRNAKDYDPTLHEHLQKKKISNTRRYKAVGNGWTVSVIKYLFGHLVAEAEQLIIDGHIIEDREVA